MKITITVINETTGNEVLTASFNNSIDANEYRDQCEAAGLEYKVQWDCK